jgi:protein tyrosine kinase modulator
MRELFTKFLDECQGIWRFRWWAVTAAWIVCVVGWISVMSLPNIYQADATAYVDTRSALQPLLQGLAVEPDVESELNLVRQALLSRPNLEKVARETDLDLRAKTPEDRERLIAGLQEKITVSAGQSPRSRRRTSDGIYRIEFQDKSREKSVEVVRTLLNTFVEDTLGGQRSGQATAQRFLEEQIAEYERRLSEAEQRLASFKRDNVGTMPDDRGDYFSRLQTAMSALQASRQRLGLAQSRRAELARQLTGEEPFVFGFDTMAPPSPDASAGSGDVAMRIRQLEQKVEELLIRYTDKHPEVVALRSQIEELKKRQAEELARLGRGEEPTGDLSQSLKSNPIYQGIQVELNNTEVQIAELSQEVVQRSKEVEELRKLVDSVPEVEAELARLNRDYDVTHRQYQALVQRLETAKISESADKTGVVKFEIIEPPTAGLEPVAPDRIAMLSMVLVLGLVSGIAMAYVLNQLKPVFHHVRGLADITGLPVLGAVSRTWLASYQAQARKHALVFSAATGLLLVCFLTVLLFHDTGVRLLRGAAG